jgi:hypothetical protein
MNVELMPRSPPRPHQITEDDWLRLMHRLERIDRRVESVSAVIATAGGVGTFWLLQQQGLGWVASFIAGIVAFMVCELGPVIHELGDAWVRRRR